MSTPKHNPGTPANQARVRQSIVHSTYDALNQRTAGLEHFPVFLEECFEARVWEKERAFASGRPCAPVSFHEFVHEQFPVGLGSSYEAIEKIIDGNPKLTAAWESASGRKLPRSDDEEPEAEVESSKLYRIAIEMIGKFSRHEELELFEAVLSQLLGRVKKQISGAR